MTRGLLGTLFTIALVLVVGVLWGLSYEQWGYFRGAVYTDDFKTRWDFRVEAYRGLIVCAVRRADPLNPHERQPAAPSRRFWVSYRNHGRLTGDQAAWMPIRQFYDLKPVDSCQLGWGRGGYPTRPTCHLLSAPFWLVMLLCLTPLAIGAARAAMSARRRRLLVRAGCCTHCGYDLRASTTRCPECGNMTELDRDFFPPYAPRQSPWIEPRPRARPYVVRFISHDTPLCAPAGQR